MKVSEFILLFVIIGVLFVLYNAFVINKEKFDNASASASAPASSASASAPASALITVPNLTNAVFILSAYSDPNLQSNTYLHSPQLWANAVPSATNGFTMVPTANGTLPASLLDKTNNVVGLPLKNVKLTGPLSEYFGDSTYTLSSFTVSFFCSINSLPNDGTTVTVYKMYAVTPNQILFNIQQSVADPTISVITCVIGTSQFTWTLETAAIVGTGNTLFTIVFDNVANTLTIYQNLRVFTSKYTPNGIITLGPIPVEINSASNFDATLLAYFFFNNAFAAADVSNLYNYMLKQSGGFYTAQIAANAQIQQAAQVQTAYEQQIQTLQSQLTTTQTQCSTAVANAVASSPVVQTNKWQINMDGIGNVQAADIKPGALNIFSPFEYNETAVSKLSLPDKWLVPSTTPSTTTTPQLVSLLFVNTL